MRQDGVSAGKNATFEWRSPVSDRLGDVVGVWEGNYALLRGGQSLRFRGATSSNVFRNDLRDAARLD
jgi:hypothetical protein